MNRIGLGSPIITDQRKLSVSRDEDQIQRNIEQILSTQGYQTRNQSHDDKVSIKMLTEAEKLKHTSELIQVQPSNTIVDASNTKMIHKHPSKRSRPRKESYKAQLMKILEMLETGQPINKEVRQNIQLMTAISHEKIFTMTQKELLEVIKTTLDGTMHPSMASSIL